MAKLFSVARETAIGFGFVVRGLGTAIVPEAQTSNGTLVGTVTDPSGAAVPNAKVKAESPQYGQPLEVTTDSAGTYHMDSAYNQVPMASRSALPASLMCKLRTSLCVVP